VVRSPFSSTLLLLFFSFPIQIRLTEVDLQGELKGFDQTTNIILSDSVERVFSADEGVEEVPLGVYIVRGDNIVRPIPVSITTPTRVQALRFQEPADLSIFFLLFPFFSSRQTLIGEVDKEADAAIDLSTVRADPIGELTH
jgi:U6 snRNA-associated Sm-like protein LSm8